MLLLIKKKNGKENMSRVQCQSEVPNHPHPNNLENWSLDLQFCRQVFYANSLNWVE